MFTKSACVFRNIFFAAPIIPAIYVAVRVIGAESVCNPKTKEVPSTIYMIAYGRDSQMQDRDPQWGLSAISSDSQQSFGVASSVLKNDVCSLYDCGKNCTILMTLNFFQFYDICEGSLEFS